MNDAPRPGPKGLRFWFASLVLWLFRWKPEGNPPQTRRYVLIAAPHTSWWDFVFMIAFGWWYGVRLRWFGKNTLFRPPFGWFFRAMGGIPVDRSAAHDLVSAVATMLRHHDDIVLAVPAEGTRKLREQWKSGFYYIAQTAGVPICLGYLDFARRRGGFGPLVHPSGDVGADMDEIRAFYADKTGKHPELFTPPRLRQEDEEGETAREPRSAP